MLAILLGIAQWALGAAQKQSDNALERFRIQTGLSVEEVRADVQKASYARDVIMSAQKNKLYWVAWGIAAIPAALWFGWGMLDSLANGALPDVAELPPQLLKYFDVVFSNIFYAGAGLGAVQVAASAVSAVVRRK